MCHVIPSKYTLIVLLAFLFSVNAFSQQLYSAPAGKEIYIPKDLRKNDFTKNDSKWSYARMAYTDDVIVFWEKSFGDDLSQAPDLDGHNMKVDLDNLLNRLQTFYDYFKYRLKFIQTGSKADRYRMMVMLNYTLEGTAYGGDYDEQIGALWISPNRVQDKKLNCIAHELGHSFQSQIACDGTGESWGGGGIFEMTSQWMLWQVNPEWTTDEHYHWMGFKDHHNLRFLHFENIYHSPYVLEYWSMKHGETIMGELFRAGKRGEDPASTYMRLCGLSLDAMNQEMIDCYSRLIAFDFPRVKQSHKKFIGDLTTPMIVSQSKNNDVLYPDTNFIPQTWGFNIIKLDNKANKKSIKITFDGINNDENATYLVRWVTLKDGEPTYGPICSGMNMKINVPTADSDNCYLVVVGCPKNTYKPYTFNPYRRSKKEKEITYPYRLTIK